MLTMREDCPEGAFWSHAREEARPHQAGSRKETRCTLCLSRPAPDQSSTISPRYQVRQDLGHGLGHTKITPPREEGGDPETVADDRRNCHIMSLTL